MRRHLAETQEQLSAANARAEKAEAERLDADKANGKLLAEQRELCDQIADWKRRAEQQASANLGLVRELTSMTSDRDSWRVEAEDRSKELTGALQERDEARRQVDFVVNRAVRHACPKPEAQGCMAASICCDCWRDWAANEARKQQGEAK